MRVGGAAEWHLQKRRAQRHGRRGPGHTREYPKVQHRSHNSYIGPSLTQWETQLGPQTQLAKVGSQQVEDFKLRRAQKVSHSSVMRIPRTKSGRPLSVPLNVTAKSTLERLSAQRQPDNPYVFPHSLGKNAGAPVHDVKNGFRAALTLAGIDGFTADRSHLSPTITPPHSTSTRFTRATARVEARVQCRDSFQWGFSVQTYAPRPGRVSKQAIPASPAQFSTRLVTPADSAACRDDTAPSASRLRRNVAGREARYNSGAVRSLF